jgi:hypothetical protein
MSGSSGMADQLGMMILGAGQLESGRASPPPRAKALAGDPGSHDAHISESRYGAPGTRRSAWVGITVSQGPSFRFEKMAAGKCVFSVYNNERGEDEQP